MVVHWMDGLTTHCRFLKKRATRRITYILDVNPFFRWSQFSFFEYTTNIHINDK